MSAKGVNDQIGAMIEFKLIKIRNRYDRIIMTQVCNRSLKHFAGNPQGKVTAKRKSRQKNRFLFSVPAKLVYRLENFFKQHGIKNTLI